MLRHDVFPYVLCDVVMCNWRSALKRGRVCGDVVTRCVVLRQGLVEHDTMKCATQVCGEGRSCLP